MCYPPSAQSTAPPHLLAPGSPPRCCRYQADAPWSLTHPTQPSVTHIQAPCLSPLRGGVYGKSSYLGIVPAANQLLVHSRESVCLCVHACYLLCVCGDRICVFLHSHLRHAAPGRALSLPQESLWERVREGFRERVCKAVRWICVHHGCIWPRGRDRRSEQRVTTKEQQIQCRVQLTHF